QPEPVREEEDDRRDRNETQKGQRDRKRQALHRRAVARRRHQTDVGQDPERGPEEERARSQQVRDAEVTAVAGGQKERRSELEREEEERRGRDRADQFGLAREPLRDAGDDAARVDRDGRRLEPGASDLVEQVLGEHGPRAPSASLRPETALDRTALPRARRPRASAASTDDRGRTPGR